MMTAWGVMHSMAADRSGLKGKTITADTRRRVWGFARPYRAWILAFIVTTVASTFLGLLPPLMIREIFDSAIAEGDGSYLNVLFAVLIAAAAGEALLSLGRPQAQLRHRRGPDPRPAAAAVRPRAAHAAGVLHPHPDRHAGEPAQQRRDRGATGLHRHARHGGGQHHHPGRDAHRHVRAGVAAHAAGGGHPARLRAAGEAGGPGSAVHHPGGHEPQRLDEQHHDRAVQRGRRAAGEAVRPPRRRGRRLPRTGPGGCATSGSAAPCTRRCS